MKTKTYKFGTHTLKSHFKTAGHGYEVTFYWGNESLFVGNFVHKSEATKWWATMNIELRKFTKKYWVADNASAAFYKNSLPITFTEPTTRASTSGSASTQRPTIMLLRATKRST